MGFSNPFILELSDIDGVGSMSKRSISGTLSPKCNQFLWKFLNFEILALKSDRYVSPQISIFSVFSQCSGFSSSLSSSNDRLEQVEQFEQVEQVEQVEQDEQVEQVE